MIAGGLAFVTGAGSDIGRAIAARLARDGYSLVLIDVNRGAVDASRAEVSGQGGTCQAFLCDVSDDSAVRDVASEALRDRPDHLSVLVNSAAIVVRQSLLDTSVRGQPSRRVRLHTSARALPGDGRRRRDRQRRVDDRDVDR